MAITKLASAAAAAGSNFATINTSGASLLILAQSANGATGPTPTDGQSNTWTAGPVLTDSGNRDEISLFYVLAPTTSATHTFSSTAAFGSAYVAAFSGTLTAAATDGTSSHSNFPNTTTETCGSITTTQNGDLVLTAFSLDDNALSGAPTIDSGMSVDGFVNANPGALFGIAAAFVIQGISGTIAPTLTRTNPSGTGRGDNAVMIAFKAAVSASQPANQHDWPNPSPVFRQEQTWTQRLKIPQPTGGPFNQADWPLPMSFYRPDYTWVQTVNLLAKPFNQSNWPLPGNYSSIDQFWSQTFLRIPTGNPFPAKDWPNAQQYTPIVQTWINSLPPGIISSLGVPTNQTDWLVPKAPLPIDQFWSINTSELPIFTPPPPQTLLGGKSILQQQLEQYIQEKSGQAISEAAKALGRLGGLKGGPARAASLHPQKRSSIARMGSHARWH